MGIINNPLDGPLTTKKIFGILVYLILASISIWATSESLNSSFNIPKPIAYLIGLAFVLTMAMFLGVIKQFLEERRVSILKLTFVILTFFVLWGVSLSTNAHKLFTQLKIQDIRKNEFDNAAIELENIGNNSLSIGKQVIGEYSQYVTSRIQDYKKEVKNIENCGHGVLADSLMSEVIRSMPGSSFTLPSGRTKSNSNCLKLAIEMESQMSDELTKRISAMESRLDELGKCKDEEEWLLVITELKEKNNLFTDFSTIEAKETISKAHKFYNQLYKCYNDGLGQSIGTVRDLTKSRAFSNNLELPVPSLNLERISYLTPYIKNYPKEKPGAYISSFWLSVAIAFILDLAAFIIFYFVILKED